VEDLLREALEEAGWRASGVDLIAASGDGSVEGDRDEAEALAAVFGAGSASPHVLAPKGILGETWGASGPLGAAAALGCMAAGTVPGRPRGFRPDPALPPLNFPEAARQAEVRRAAVLARSASGHLSALLLESAEGARGG
jgi:3-oxoacyl-(acyl-carrier-protein) synthase